MRKPLSVPWLLWILSPLSAGEDARGPAWDLPAEAVRAELARAGGAEAFGGAEIVVVFDRRDVEVEQSGLARTVHHALAKALTPAGARILAAIAYPYDPLCAAVTILRCRVFPADGGAREIDPALALDLPAPQHLIYWNARHKLLPVGRIAPGDAVETVVRRVGFSYALLAAEGPADEERFVPPMRGHFYDIVPFWASHPVIEQRYRVALPLEKPLQYQFFHGAAEVSDRIEGEKRVVTVTMRGAKPLEPESGMVAHSDVAPKLILTTTHAWRDKAIWFHATQEAAGSFELAPAVREAAARVTAGLARPEEKVAALTHWVAENIRYVGLHMGPGEGYTLHPAAMTLRDRGGVCKDKAGLLVALLRAAGFEAYAAMTMAGERIEDIPADQFNHCVTVWRKPDRTTVLLDPTWVPGVRELWSSREQEQEVLMGLPEGSDLLTTPISPPEDHPLRVELRTRLHPDGALEGRMEVESDGQSDASIRRVYRSRPRGDWPAIDRRWIAAADPRAEVRDVARADPDDISVPFAIALSFRIPGYARRLDDGSLLLVPLSARHPVGEALDADELRLATDIAERRFPARIRCTKLVELSERMELPAGASVEGVPLAMDLQGRGAFAAKWTLADGGLAVAERLLFRSRLIAPERWPEVRAALEALRACAKTPILVRLPRDGKEGA